MFFKRRKKSPEQLENEKRIMWVHEHATYLTYIDEADRKEDWLEFEGPHSFGRVEEGMKLMILDCNGKQLGVFQVETSDVKKQKRLQGSVNTGEYLYLTGEMISGDLDNVLQASMLVNENLKFEKEN